jgi:pyruvate formate lyase activating enzyme
MLGLKVGGFTPLTLTDYPDHLAAVVFCQGCPWRCGYCHNPHLLPWDREERQERQGRSLQSWESILEFLKRRRGLLDAVVFSGGEPMAQPGLGDAIHQTRALGYKIGVHSGGSYPERLRGLLPSIDWVGLDVKADFESYHYVTHVPGSGLKALQSLRFLLESGLSYEVRTTVHPDLHRREDIYALASRLASLGVKSFVLQEFRSDGCANRNLTSSTQPSFLDSAYCNEVGRVFEKFEVRGHT